MKKKAKKKVKTRGKVVKHKHQWKKQSNSKFTYICKRCGMKRTMKKIMDGKGRHGFRMEVTFHLPNGTKVTINRHHNFKTPPCKPAVMKKAA